MPGMNTADTYPLNTAQPWPRNQWWVAAMADEVGPEPLERTILGEPVVLFRTEAGDPVAMSGVCPHRGYPMAKARRTGDALECAYHGFTFDAGGACTRIPSQDSVPPNWRIRTYPAVQRWAWIWIWTGDPALADPARIPDPWCVDKPGWRTQSCERAAMTGRYTLLLDNLFDLSHLNYIHADKVGDVSAVVRTPVEMLQQLDGAFRLIRRVEHMPWSDFLSAVFAGGVAQPEPVYNEVFSDYYGPSLIITGGPFFLQASRARLGELNFLHAMTPETQTTTHYFGGVARDFRLEDPACDGFLGHVYDAVRQQDLDAFVCVEPNVGRFLTTRQELSAFQDAGGVRVRRLLAEQINAEQDIGR
jgi:nitrite reductase/ring-hydroxylating ferredoxin subunit